MDYLKNVFQTIEESNTEDKVYSCQLLFPIVISLIESVTSLIIGMAIRVVEFSNRGYKIRKVFP